MANMAADLQYGGGKHTARQVHGGGFVNDPEKLPAPSIHELQLSRQRENQNAGSFPKIRQTRQLRAILLLRDHNASIPWFPSAALIRIAVNIPKTIYIKTKSMDVR